MQVFKTSTALIAKSCYQIFRFVPEDKVPGF